MRLRHRRATDVLDVARLRPRVSLAGHDHRSGRQAGRGGGAQCSQRRRGTRNVVRHLDNGELVAPAAPTGSGSGSEMRGLGRMPWDRAIGTPARAKVRCRARAVSRCER